MIKINSELPNCMLDCNNDLNEYDFVLYHLLISDKTYRDYYIEQRKREPFRIMILDNSAYEFFVKGEKLNIKDYLNIVVKLKPDYFILPDTLMDKKETLNQVRETLRIIKNDTIYNKIFECSRPLGVLQGNSTQELIECAFQYNTLDINNLCIPFHNSFFKDIGKCSKYAKELSEMAGKDVDDDILYAAGRVEFMSNPILKKYDYIHLLGSHCIWEKVYYKDFDSMDTGYPVKCGYCEIELGREKKKPDIIIDSFLNENLTTSQIDTIKYNVGKFKSI